MGACKDLHSGFLQTMDALLQQKMLPVENLLESGFVQISESTLYPILRRLESAELISVRTAEHNGRLRKYYSITRAGLERIAAFREEWSEVMSIYRFVTKEDGNE